MLGEGVGIQMREGVRRNSCKNGEYETVKGVY